MLIQACDTYGGWLQSYFTCYPTAPLNFPIYWYTSRMPLSLSFPHCTHCAHLLLSFIPLFHYPLFTVFPFRISPPTFHEGGFHGIHTTSPFSYTSVVPSNIPFIHYLPLKTSPHPKHFFSLFLIILHLHYLIPFLSSRTLPGFICTLVYVVSLTILVI